MLNFLIVRTTIKTFVLELFVTWKLSITKVLPHIKVYYKNNLEFS